MTDNQAEAALREEIYRRLSDLADTDPVSAFTVAYSLLVNFIASFGPREFRDNIIAGVVESLSDDVEKEVSDAKPYHDA